MKKSIIVLLIMTFGFSFASNSVETNKSESIPKIELDNPSIYQSSFFHKVFVDCTITVQGTFNGVEVDVEVTISDVSWLKCQAVKLLAKDKIAELAD